MEDQNRGLERLSEPRLKNTGSEAWNFPYLSKDAICGQPDGIFMGKANNATYGKGGRRGRLARDLALLC